MAEKDSGYPPPTGFQPFTNEEYRETSSAPQSQPPPPPPPQYVPDARDDRNNYQGHPPYYPEAEDNIPLSTNKKVLYGLWGFLSGLILNVFGLIPICFLRNRHRKQSYSIGFIIGIVLEFILTVFAIRRYNQAYYPYRP